MSKRNLNPLAITTDEMRKLRALKIRKNELHHHTAAELQEWMGISRNRARELYALSEFQSVPSLGIRFAHDLISMGYYSLRDLRGKDGARLTHEYEKQVGAWVDPCVEDSFRLAVHYAKHPDSKLNWWDLTAERKAYREKHGYPADRPRKPWYELQHPSQQIDASREDTQKDLHTKLKRALAYMKKHADEPLTIAQLADIAHLSSYHFIRCFKSAYEHTPLQYLTHLRLKKASLLLKKSRTPVGGIVAQCGFQNESAFIRLFKREFRMTPLAYRKTFGAGK
jgi:AraC-like DNA-binding protein